MIITTVLFDIGDVLIDIDWQHGYRKMLGHMKHADGSDMSLDQITEKLNPGPYGSVWDDFGKGALTQDQFLDEICARTGYAGEKVPLASALTQIFNPLPHRIALLNRMIADGRYQVALVSDTNKMHMDYIECTIPDIFKNIPIARRYYSYNLGMKKKLGKEIYEYVLNDMGAKPENTLMIDDRDQNRIGAEEIGLPFLLIQKNEDLEAALKAAPHRLAV